MSRRSEAAEEPSETVQMFQALHRERQARHSRNHATNMELIERSPHTCTETANGTCLLFREKGKPKVDFYPHTGRWKCKGRMYRGGAKSFLTWYAKQTEHAR